MMTSALRKLRQLLLLLQLLSTVLVHVYVVTYLSSLFQRWSMNRLTLLSSSDDGGRKTLDYTLHWAYLPTVTTCSRVTLCITRLHIDN